MKYWIIAWETMTPKPNLLAKELLKKKLKNIENDYSVDLHIETGDCGMGMPVIRSWQAMKKLSIGNVLQLTSSHP